MAEFASPVEAVRAGVEIQSGLWSRASARGFDCPLRLPRSEPSPANLAYIPPTFKVPLTDPFEQHYMNELFSLGYEVGRSGYAWAKAPPGH